MEGSIDDVLLGEGGAAGGAEEREDDAFVRGLFQSLLLTTRASNALPSGGDYEYANTYPSFREASQGAGEDVLGLLQEVLSHVGIGEGAEGAAGGEGLAEPEIFEAVADAVDGLLEEVDMQLDEMSGSGAQQQVSQMAKLLSSASNLPKPQEKFSKVPENARPLEGESAYSADGGHAEREHLALLDNLAYLEWQLAPAEEESPLPDPVPDPPYAVPPEIAARYVGTQEELDALRANLVAAREVGIDLEHHSFRSFQGFTCLMQITANGQDWLVDTLLLRHALHCLNAVFEDPSIVKVLHGCDSDVVWMQRDFGLYLVNVFDTGQAARYLGLQSFGLAYLLSTYCGVNVSKAHQLSDWRIRPLPDAMARYAQRDTRYLSYLHEVMRKELWGRGGRAAIAQVLDSSKEICRKRYERPRFDPFGWSTALQRQRTREGGAPLEPASMRAMEKLWDWRDAVAREEDESVSYVMSLRLMLRIAKELPLSIDALNLCGRPLPPLVQARSRQLLTIVTRALEEPELPDLAAKAQTPKAKHVPMAAEANAFTPVASEPYFRPFSVTPSHASEFVIQAMHSAQSKSAAAGAGGGHRSSDQPPPPVLDTEELYRTAGWTTPTPKHDNSKLRLAPENSSLDASLPMPHSLPLGSRNGRDDEGQASAHGRAQARLIRDEIAREPIMSLRNAKGFAKEAENADDMEVGAELGDGMEGIEAEAEGDAEVPGIPKSMADIYKISNRNRRRNKDKKKLQDDVSPVDIAETAAESALRAKSEELRVSPADRMAEYFSGRKRQKSEGKEGQDDTLDFIEGIEWMSHEERELLASEVQSQQTGGPPPVKSGDTSKGPVRGSVAGTKEPRERSYGSRRARGGGGKDGGGGATGVDYSALPASMGANPFLAQQQGGSGSRGGKSAR